MTCPKLILEFYSIKDVSGNVNTCSQLVIVNDNIAPIVTAPATASVNCDQSVDPLVNGSLGIATATDNCTAPNAITISHTDASAQGSNPAACTYYTYTITRTWVATDMCSNSSSANQTINVVDNVAPTITSCNPITVNLDGSGNYTLSIADMKAIAFGGADNCASAAFSILFS